jgi:cytochrome c-type biogenesis protein CcmE
MLLIILGLACLGGAVAFVLNAFTDNMVFFFSPTEVSSHHIKEGQVIRIGGLVKEGSVTKSDNGLTTTFVITDLKEEITVQYKGLLPTLFREGQGMVAKGSVNSDHIFIADELLAKHDEKYMPPEVAKALKKSGRWKEGEEVKP